VRSGVVSEVVEHQEKGNSEMVTKRRLSGAELGISDDQLEAILNPEKIQQFTEQVCGWELVSLEGLRFLPRPQWVVPGLVEANGLTLVSARGNRGKTAVVMTMMWDQLLHWVRDEEVREGHVDGISAWSRQCFLYVTQEGLYGISPRYEAWCRSRQVNPQERAYVSSRFKLHMHAEQLGVSMRSNSQSTGEGLPELVSVIEELKPGLVVIDPWADYFTPGEENSNDDVRKWIQLVRDRIVNAGTPLVVLTHTSKGDLEESRGASALYDGADRAYFVLGEMEKLPDKQEGNLLSIKFYCKKAKDGGRDVPKYFRAHDYEDIRSFALVHASDVELREAPPSKSSKLGRILAYLEERGGSAPAREVKEAMAELYNYSPSSVANAASEAGLSRGNRGRWSVVDTDTDDPEDLE
jgi:hypothetical protein